MKSNASQAAMPRLRAQFVSDNHLFHRHNGGAKYQLQTLYATNPETTYIVGDSVDMLEIQLRMAMDLLGPDRYPVTFAEVLSRYGAKNTETHLRVFDTLMQRVENGGSVVLLGGNHDPGFDLLDGQAVNGIKIRKEAVYKGADGLTYQVEHGHRFDPGCIQDYQAWHMKAACYLLDSALWFDHGAAPYIGDSYPMSTFLKTVAKSSYLPIFKQAAMAKAQAAGVDGIICGHLHIQEYVPDFHSGLRDMFNTHADQDRKVAYLNCGDGLTHGTTIGQTPDGEWALVGRKNIPESAAAILATTNPLAIYREKTMAFLQAAWEAHLQTLARKSTVPDRVEDFGFDQVLAPA